jgi:hypothetical protein
LRFTINTLHLRSASGRNLFPGAEHIDALRLSGCMTSPQMTTEEIELDREWRARFGQPLPMLGCADIVRRILLAPENAGEAASA